MYSPDSGAWPRGLALSCRSSWAITDEYHSGSTASHLSRFSQSVEHARIMRFDTLCELSPSFVCHAAGQTQNMILYVPGCPVQAGGVEKSPRDRYLVRYLYNPRWPQAARHPFEKAGEVTLAVRDYW
ncbi:hypothetical protein GCM10027444_31890 [Actinopolyspora lacussalsi]